MILQPTKSFVTGATVSGKDFTGLVRGATIHETVCKPYHTATVTVLDNANMINRLGLVGGEPVSFTIGAGDGLERTFSGLLFSIKGQPAAYNMRSVSYEITAITPEYFGDRASTVQQAFRGVTGTGIISAIHSSYVGGSGIRVPLESAGLIGKDNSYVVKSSKPFKAINDVRKIMTFPGVSSSNLYYRDKDGAVIAPLEWMMNSMGSQATFVQRNVSGADWRNVFGAYDTILSAAAVSRASVRTLAAVGGLERKVLDVLSSKRIFDVFGSGGKGHGGLHNYYLTDSTIVPKESTRQTDRDRAYSASVEAGPQYLVTVPIQLGIGCTVGKGVTALLKSPSGDATNIGADDEIETGGGLMLAADLSHECVLDERGGGMTGKTHFRLVKGAI